MLSGLRRFLADRIGNFTTMTALAFPVMVVGVGLTLDSATLYVQKRDLQGTADLAAIFAAANIDKAAQAAALTLTDNGYSGVQTVNATQLAAIQASKALTNTLLVQPGHYTADSTKTLAQRFVVGGAPTNAVKVSLRTRGATYFPQTVFANTMIGASAIALITPEASFQVGSRLAALDGGILNGALGALLGTTLNLSVADYNALLGTNVDALTFMDTLASDLSLTAGSYQNVLNTSTSVANVIKATAKVPGISVNAKNAIAKIVAALPVTNRSMALGKLLGLGSMASSPVGSRPGGIAPKVGLLDLIYASAAISNGTRQVSTSLGVNLSPLANVTLDLAIGEPPQGSAWIKMGAVGSVVYTAQTRLKIKADIGSFNYSSLLIPKSALVSIPIYLELGSAKAELTSLTCAGNDITTVKATINVTPALATLVLSDVDKTQMANFSSTPAFPVAKLVDVLGVLGVTASQTKAITVGNIAATPVNFTYNDIVNRTVKTVSTKNYTQSLTTSLLTDLKLTVTLLGLNLLPLGTLSNAVAALITPATPLLDTVLNGVLTTLGVKLGSADVWMDGATCGKAVLVQ